MYADHAATARPTLYDVGRHCQYGNPSARHRVGMDARAASDAARERIAAALGLETARHLIVTSGGTESNNLIIQQPVWRFIVTAATEHPAVYHTVQYVESTGRSVAYLQLDGQGARRPLFLRGACDPGGWSMRTDSCATF